MATTVAVLGTGTMGKPMARNLLGAGFEVRVWNRTRDRAEPLGEAGAEVADSPAEAVRGASIVITILTDAEAVAQTMGGALEAMESGALWLQMSTVGVDGAKGLAELAAENGIVYVDAPVLGTRQPAEQGELTVLASGPAEAREGAQPVFEAVGKTIRWVGDAGAGSRLKMVTNLWLLAVMEAAAESIALAEGLGLDPREFLETMAGGPIDSPYLQLKGGAILNGELAPSFALENAAKDAALVLEAAERAGIEAALPRAYVAQFQRAIELGYGKEDMAATYYASRSSS